MNDFFTGLIIGELIGNILKITIGVMEYVCDFLGFMIKDSLTLLFKFCHHFIIKPSI